MTAHIDTEPSAGPYTGLAAKATRAFSWSFLNTRG